MHASTHTSKGPVTLPIDLQTIKMKSLKKPVTVLKGIVAKPKKRITVETMNHAVGEGWSGVK